MLIIYFKKIKKIKLFKNRYNQLSLKIDINKYICNYFYKCIYIFKNYILKLLQLLLIFKKIIIVYFNRF